MVGVIFSPMFLSLFFFFLWVMTLLKIPLRALLLKVWSTHQYQDHLEIWITPKLMYQNLHFNLIRYMGNSYPY